VVDHRISTFGIIILFQDVYIINYYILLFVYIQYIFFKTQNKKPLENKGVLCTKQASLFKEATESLEAIY